MLRFHRWHRYAAVAFAITITFAFTMMLTLYLGASQFTDAMRAAVDVRLSIAADDVSSALEAAVRVGVTIQRSPAVVALLRRTLASDPMIAAIVLRDTSGKPILQIGDPAAASADSRLTIERPVVSDFGVPVAEVRVAARRALFGRQTAAAAYALLIPALLAAAVGTIATTGAVMLTMAAFGRGERVRRTSLAAALDERIAAAERALADAEGGL